MPILNAIFKLSFKGNYFKSRYAVLKLMYILILKTFTIKIDFSYILDDRFKFGST